MATLACSRCRHRIPLYDQLVARLRLAAGHYLYGPHVVSRRRRAVLPTVAPHFSDFVSSAWLRPSVGCFDSYDCPCYLGMALLDDVARRVVESGLQRLRYSSGRIIGGLRA